MLNQLSSLDLLALVWFFICFIGYGLITRRGKLAKRGIMTAIQKQRIRWIEMMAGREMRMMDVQLMAILSNANTFFASTSVIAIGGLAAALAAGDELKNTFESLPFIVETSKLAWRLKWILLIGLFIYAFFKFAWAYRLSHYTAIMIGATPDSSETGSLRDQHVQQTAALAGNSAENFNAGLRTYYFAIAAASWLLHPLLFVLMTSWVLAILIRREFWSNALETISGPET